MAGSVNRVTLLGNVGKDPEVRTTQDGKKIVNMTLATSESWKDKNSGERKERTEWHKIVVFNERITDVVEKYVHKGSKIYVEGALRTRKWTDQSGQEKYSTEIVIENFRGELTLLGDPQGGGDARPRETVGSNGSRDPRYGGPQGGSQQWSAPKTNDLDDEIPF